MRRSSLGASMSTVALGGDNAVADTPPVAPQVTGTVGGVQGAQGPLFGPLLGGTALRRLSGGHEPCS